MPPGASRGDIEAAFTGWRITHEDAYAGRSTLPSWLKNVKLCFFPASSRSRASSSSVIPYPSTDFDRSACQAERRQH